MALDGFFDEFGDDDFIKLNEEYFKQYVEYRVHGFPANTAFLRVFGREYWGETPQEGWGHIEAIEHTDWYHTTFNARLKEIPTENLFNAKLAMHLYLQTVRSPDSSNREKTNAVKELCVLTGVTIVDENGKTKVGRTLDDFYTAIEQQKKAVDKAKGLPGPKAGD